VQKLRAWFVDNILFPMRGVGDTLVTLIKCVFYPKDKTPPKSK